MHVSSWHALFVPSELRNTTKYLKKGGITYEFKHVGAKNADFWNVFMAVRMMNVFCDIIPCNSSKNRCFGETYRLNLQGNETLESSQLAAKLCLVADSEGSPCVLNKLFIKEYIRCNNSISTTTPR
jgi:hypothetical protein